jgi:hypothetical protein
MQHRALEIPNFFNLITGEMFLLGITDKETMKQIIIIPLFFLLVLFLASTGCVQVDQTERSCGGGYLGMNYVEHTYLWGNENFMTKRYDVSIYAFGGPNVKTDISKFEFDEYQKTYCSVSTQRTQTTSPTPVTTRITTIRTPYPTPVPTYAPKITDGFWCRFTTKNIGKDPTDVTECYQFFTDGTFKWGYSPGYPMGKSPSCWSPDVKCVYSYNSNGKYEVQGGYSYTLSGINLIDPHDPPYFVWRATGIP